MGEREIEEYPCPTWCLSHPLLSGYSPLWDYCRCSWAPTSSAWPVGALTRIVHRIKARIAGERAAPPCSEKGRVEGKETVYAFLFEEELGQGTRVPPLPPWGVFCLQEPGHPRLGLPLPLSQFPALPPLASTCTQQPKPQECPSFFPYRIVHTVPFPSSPSLRSSSGWEGHTQLPSPPLPHGLALTQSLSLRHHKAH